MSKPCILVLISGSGTNLQAIIDAVGDGRIPAHISLVISNRKAAYGLTRAEQAGIPTLYFPFKPYRQAEKSRQQYDADLAAKLKTYRPDLIVLAGWMRVLSPAFLDQFPQQVINLHPALPRQFAGTHAIERAFDAYQQGEIAYSGCMVHYVIPEVDAGRVIAQTIVPIHREDDLVDFESRMHTVEHQLIVHAIKLALSVQAVSQSVGFYY
ncbi:MAG: phosphoribosylglycinamide formyltransferase [Chloroflexi bacterium]|nr:phosphoribosylglycinamide formyltransferase [Chloroflexota bacterium]